MLGIGFGSDDILEEGEIVDRERERRRDQRLPFIVFSKDTQ